METKEEQAASPFETNPSGEMKEGRYTVPGDLASILGLQAGLLQSKSWTYARDPWVFYSTPFPDPTHKLGQIHGISVALTLSDTPHPPYFDLRSVVIFSKLSWGWRTQADGITLSINLKDRNGVPIYSFILPVPSIPPTKKEIVIACHQSGQQVAYTHNIDTNIFNDVNSAYLHKDAGDWARCS